MSGQLKRAAVYCRVASPEDADMAIREQINVCQDYAAQNDYTVVTSVTEQAGGLDRDRDGLNALLKLAEDKTVDVIIVKSLDRITRRGFIEAMDYVEQLQSLGAAVEFADGVDYQAKYADFKSPFWEAVKNEEIPGYDGDLDESDNREDEYGDDYDFEDEDEI